MTDPTLCFDLWTIRKLENDDFDQAHWHFPGLMDQLTVDASPDRRNDRRKTVMNDSWDQYQTDRGE